MRPDGTRPDGAYNVVDVNWRLFFSIVVAVVVGVLALALAAEGQITASAVTFSGVSIPRVAQIPAQGDWTDHGVILSGGDSTASPPGDGPGAWEQRLEGMLHPTLVEFDDKLLIYYIGASGNRGDGGPAFRKLGVASCSTAADCTSASNWTRYASNPIITHETPAGCNEAGVFSVAARADGATLHLWYGGMEEASGTPPDCSGSVDGDGLHTTSSDGFTFAAATDKVIDGTCSPDNHAGCGDELFPTDAVKIGSTWYVYYQQGVVDMFVAWGTNPATVADDNSAAFFNGASNVWRGSGIVHRGGGRWVQFIGYHTTNYEIEVYDLDPDDPTTLGTNLDTYDFAGMNFGSIIMSGGKWWMAYVEAVSANNTEDIGIRTATVTY